MDFRILGPVEARRGDGSRVALSGSKLHTVLATMLLARGRVVSDERLSTMLWGWAPPATSGAQIYTYMSRLRKHLGEEAEVARRAPGYQLKAPDSTVDLLEFERLEAVGRKALQQRRYEEAGTALRAALGLWQGTALANATESMMEAELPRLEEARMLALESRIEADLALGRHEMLTAELTGLVSDFPVRENLRAQLMTALYRCGRQADALGTFYEGRQVLAEQLGVDPGESLGATYQAVLGGELALPAGEHSEVTLSSPGVRPPDPGAPAMLPPALEDFVGREGERAALRRRLTAEGNGNGPRRFLITGMAGVGKTSLAVRVAHDCATHYPDGQIFARLSEPDGTPRDPRDVLVRLLRALGETGLGGGSPVTEYSEQTAPTEATARTGYAADLEELVRLYRTRTAGRRLLVVLDNATGDRQLAPLLPGSAQSAVLITGRVRLARVQGALTTALAPIDDDTALELLASAAGRSRITEDPDASDDLVSYCAGLPLALRITGTRLAARPHWPAGRLAARLAHPADRLRELSYGDLDLTQSLMPSVRRLPAYGLDALARLAPAGTDPLSAQDAADRLGVDEASAEVALEALVDAALLDISGLDDQGRPLYRFHELVAHFARAENGLPQAAGPVRTEDATPTAAGRY